MGMTSGMRHPERAQSNGIRARGSRPMSRAIRHGDDDDVVVVVAVGMALVVGRDLSALSLDVVSWGGG